jgi:hypothetical protein
MMDIIKCKVMLYQSMGICSENNLLNLHRQRRAKILLHLKKTGYCSLRKKIIGNTMLLGIFTDENPYSFSARSSFMTFIAADSRSMSMQKKFNIHFVTDVLWCFIEKKNGGHNSGGTL